jgi:hypothetical protein
VSRWLARHDRFPGDWIEVNIDSYYDQRTAFSFTLSLSGTRGDEFISNDGENWDPSWDPIWSGATAAVAEGWTAEMRIPLGQLRFSDAPEQTWGLQLTRRLFRKEERSTWQHIPKDVTGWVSHFGQLRGIENIEPSRRVELRPYGVAQADRFEEEPGNPFADGQTGSLTAGLDGKIGVTSDLTLDFTVNPDFGQVEADPSEVNLTEFETFFRERRPFFVEGQDIFDLPLAPAFAGGDFTRDTLFYSRRVGGQPSHSPELEPGAFADEPFSSSILGAFKLSGKTPSGLTIGVLDSLTARESAAIDEAGDRRRESVEPLTNFFVGRVQQELRAGETQLGGMLTAVHRDIDVTHLEFLPARAFAGGIDLLHHFNDRDYRIEANIIGSYLGGSERAIEDVQTSSARYFQRPDNDYVTFDPARTSLTGHSGSVRVTRTSNSRLTFQTGVAYRSPGFEINELGFMRNADQINQFTWVGYRFDQPFSIFRQLRINANQWFDWDFGGHLLRKAFNTNAHAHFRNNYRLGFGITREGEYTSNTRLRGGPSSKWPGGLAYDAYVESDSRRRFAVGGGLFGHDGDDNSGHVRRFWADLTVRPTNAISIAFSPELTDNRQELQYVDTQSFNDEDRFLLGSLDQDTLSLTFRVDLAITPSLTVQYYGSPFASSGRYAQHKRITRPLADRYSDRFAAFAPDQIAFDAAEAAYRVDEDRDGSVDYSFDNPDFDLREFNSTLVLRWEYHPGSLLYVVWSQARVDDVLRNEDPALAGGVRDVFQAPPHDVLLIKLSHWFSF